MESLNQRGSQRTVSACVCVCLNKTIDGFESRTIGFSFSLVQYYGPMKDGINGLSLSLISFSHYDEVKNMGAYNC